MFEFGEEKDRRKAGTNLTQNSRNDILKDRTRLELWNLRQQSCEHMIFFFFIDVWNCFPTVIYHEFSLVSPFHFIFVYLNA